MSGYKKIVCAYSGGLDTSVMIPWLRENYGAEIISYTGDLGQGDDLPAIKRKALDTGASHAVVDDLRERFVTEFIWPAIKGSAVYEGMYPLHTALGRPLLSQHWWKWPWSMVRMPSLTDAPEKAMIRFALK